MLFTEAQLNSANPMAVLDEAVYLDESESLINPATVPVREMRRLGEGVTMVRFDDIAALAESHGTNYIDAMVAVAEASGVNPELMAVAVDEAEIIANPNVVLELANVVVAPLSEDSLAARYVNECVDLWSQMSDTDEANMALAEALIDDTYLQTFLEADGEGAASTNSTEDRLKEYGLKTDDVNLLRGKSKDAMQQVTKRVIQNYVINQDDGWITRQLKKTANQIVGGGMGTYAFQKLKGQMEKRIS